MKAEDFGGRFAADIKNLQELSTTARQDPRAGLKVAAQQFEALFMQMMLKSMRDATPQDGIFDSDQTRFYTSMFDQQLAQDLSAKGSVGLAKMIEKQLGRNLPEAHAEEAGVSAVLSRLLTAPSASRAAPAVVQVPAAAASSSPAATGSAPGAAPGAVQGAPAAANTQPAEAEFAGRRAFVAEVWPHALEASKATGIPAHFLVAHAALESGWGRSEPRRADGSPSHNLFGVKAGRRWGGDSVEATTTEYVNGKEQESREKFRAYGSYLESFRDYAALLKNNSRFSSVLGTTDGTEFARQLQQAGYASDPMYADKLSRIISGQTLRRALLG